MADTPSESRTAALQHGLTRIETRGSEFASPTRVLILLLVAAAALGAAIVVNESGTGGLGVGIGDADYGYYQQRKYDSNRLLGWGDNPGMRARDGVVYDQDSYDAGPRFDNATEAQLRAQQNYRTFRSAEAERNRGEGFDGTIWDTPTTPNSPLDADISAPPVNGDPIPLGYGYSDEYQRLQTNPYTDALRAEFGWAATPPSAQYGYGSGSYPTRSYAPLTTRTARTRARQGEVTSLADRRMAAERKGNKALVAYLEGYRGGCRWLLGTNASVGIDGQAFTLADCLLNEPGTSVAAGTAPASTYRSGFQTVCDVLFAGSSTGVITRNGVDVSHGECALAADRARPRR